MKGFYVDTTTYLVKHLPIDSKLLRDVSFLHPQLRKNDHDIEAVCRIAVMWPTVSDEEVALITDEWKVYQSGDEVVDTSQRVDYYWASVFQEKTSQGQFRYSILPKLVKSVLSLAHGNADVERSLSPNKRTVTADRASLSDVTINGLRTAKYQVKVHGRPHEDPITSGLLLASRLRTRVNTNKHS